MSAHPIAEPHFVVDRADADPIVDAAEESLQARDRYRQSTKKQLDHRSTLHVISDLSDVNPWVMSRARCYLDRAVATVVLVILLPALLLFTLLVRVTSRGPALFRQRRAGRNREEFTLYKFRSMSVEDADGPAITVSGDQRITRMGAFLRRYKLDELPQFWNVLKGNMSLVGPRPKLPHHEGLDLPYRPGITGMATLAFRDEEKILAVIPRDQLEDFYEMCIKPRKAQLDLEYMRTATLGSDLKLLWRTGASCLFGPDAMSLEETRKLVCLAAAWLDHSQDLTNTAPSEVEVG